MQQHGNTYFSPQTPTDPGDGVNRSKFSFSERGHVAYQFKGNYEMQHYGSKYIAHRAVSPPPPTLGMGSVGQKLTI